MCGQPGAQPVALLLTRAFSKMGDVFHGAQLLQMARAAGAGLWCKLGAFPPYRHPCGAWLSSGPGHMGHG